MCEQTSDVNVLGAAPKIGLNAAFRQFQNEVPLDRLNFDQRRALGDIAACRTVAMGFGVLRCDHCGKEFFRPRSCKNRNCTCHKGDSLIWTEHRKAQILGVAQLHLRFQGPSPIQRLGLACYAFVGDALLRSSWEAIKEYYARRKLETGSIGEVHSANRNLNQDFHTHQYPPAGGIGPDGKWREIKGDLKKMCRELEGLFKHKLMKFVERELRRPTHGIEREKLLKLLLELKHTRVVVRCRKDEEILSSLNYLAKAAHQTAISDERITAIDEKTVTFKGVDNKIMQLQGPDFILRVLRHVPPSRYCRVRYFGLYASPCKEKLERARTAIPKIKQVDLLIKNIDGMNKGEAVQAITGKDFSECPSCKQGRLEKLFDWPAGRRLSTGKWVACEDPC